MIKANISPANYRRIMANVTGEPGGLQESKLQAFFRLIQARGHVITNEAGVLLYGGAKALKIAKQNTSQLNGQRSGGASTPAK